jgi:hypothetical protein
MLAIATSWNMPGFCDEEDTVIAVTEPDGDCDGGVGEVMPDEPLPLQASVKTVPMTINVYVCGRVSHRAPMLELVTDDIVPDERAGTVPYKAGPYID